MTLPDPIPEGACSPEASQATQGSEPNSSDLCGLVPVGYCTVSQNGLILQANQVLSTFLGVAHDALVKQALSRFIVREDHGIFDQLQQRLYALAAALPGRPDTHALEPLACELRLARSDGTLCWVFLTAVVTACTTESAGPAPCDPGLVLRLTVSDLTHSKQVQSVLQQTLLDKDALLKEVHHRVKNNLQVITSLLRLESGRSQQPDTRSVMSAMRARIRSIALLHELLCRSGRFETIDLADYLKQIATEAVKAQALTPGMVHLRLHLCSVAVNMDQALACGLLVTELLSNCLKHGFTDRRLGEIDLTLQASDTPESWRLGVRDNGVGLPADFEDRNQTSLGLQLVSDLALQLGGELSITSQAGQGAEFAVVFKPQVSAVRAPLV